MIPFSLLSLSLSLSLSPLNLGLDRSYNSASRERHAWVGLCRTSPSRLINAGWDGMARLMRRCKSQEAKEKGPRRHTEQPRLKEET